MNKIYPECDGCIAYVFCNKVKGTAPINPNQNWCNGKFRLDKAIELSHLPEEYLNANMYNYKKDDVNEETYKRIRPFIADIVEEVNNGLNVFLYSKGCGNGKTFHASIFLNHYIYKICNTRDFDFETPLACFVDYAELMNMVRYNRDTISDIWQQIEIIKNVPLLVLDDLGSGTMSDFTREQTYLILNYRFNKNLSTVATSNNSIDDLAKANLLGKRNVSRLTRNLLYLEIKGKDRRVSLR